jgi:chorismate dehydratase
MDPTRIACVRYLNTVPLIEGLDRLEGLTLLPVVPSHIAPMLHRREADIGLVSLIDAGRAPMDRRLTLIPAGMIGCDGPTLTVRIFSAVPLDQVRAIHADTDSHTSIVLAQVIFHHRYGRIPEIIDFDARERIATHPAAEPASPHSPPSPEGWPETLLLIGDKVVTDSPPAVRYPHQLDLGDAWKQLTGLPFVYAMWACRAEDADSPRIAAAARLLDRQLRHNQTRIDWIVSKHAPEHRWPPDLAAKYLGSYLRFQVGPREREAAQRFLTEAAALGLVEQPELTWLPEPALAH